MIPSAVDPDYECVLADTVDDGGPPAPPPPGGAVEEGPGLCPEGYVPRRRRRRRYELDGKRLC